MTKNRRNKQEPDVWEGKIGGLHVKIRQNLTDCIDGGSAVVNTTSKITIFTDQGSLVLPDQVHSIKEAKIYIKNSMKKRKRSN